MNIEKGKLQFKSMVSLNGTALAVFPEWECITCNTAFIANLSTKKPVCNGVEINLCPWCRQDSQTWKNGRGK